MRPRAIGVGLSAIIVIALWSDPTAALAQGSQRLAGWNIEYRMPDNFRVLQTMGRLQIVGSDTEAGAIFVAPGLYTNQNEAMADLGIFAQQLGVQGYPVEGPTATSIAGLQAMVATFQGQDQMMRPLQSRFIALFTPHGTGILFLAMTTPDQFSGLKNTVEQMAQTVTAQAPEYNQQAVAALAGTWVFYEGGGTPGVGSQGSTNRGVNETVQFDGQGRYQWQSEAYVSAQSYGRTGGANSSSSQSDVGTYTVIGNTLVMKGQQGQYAVDIEFAQGRIVAGGKTYIRQN